MNIFGVLTVIFIVLKLLGVITWSWWIVFSPLYLAILLTVISFIFVGKAFKRIEESVKDKNDCQ